MVKLPKAKLGHHICHAKEIVFYPKANEKTSLLDVNRIVIFTRWATERVAGQQLCSAGQITEV